MKKELIIGFVCAIFGGSVAFGFDVLKEKYLKEGNPLAEGLVELSHANKELALEHKSLSKSIEALAKKTDKYPELKIELGNIVNRVTNIVSTSVNIESKTSDVASIAATIKGRNFSSKYNPNADVVIPLGKAVTVCGNENTLGVVRESGSFRVYLNNKWHPAKAGLSLNFDSPAGPSMVSYLGKSAEQHYEFRIVCGAKK